MIRFLLGNYKKLFQFRIIIAALALNFLAACPMPDFGGGSQGPKVDITQPVTVALLVPNGGSNGNLNYLGNTLEAAAKMAITDHNRGEIDLRVYSTGGNPATAVAMATKAKNEGAAMIIGPLKSEEAVQVAASVDVPVLTFSNNSEIAHENVYLLGNSFDIIADRVVDYAKSTGSNNLGIIFTDDLGGEQGANATREAAKSSRMRVVAEAKYPLTIAGIDAVTPKVVSLLREMGADSVMFTDNPAGGLNYLTTKMAKQGYTSQSARYMGIAKWNEPAELLSQGNLEGGLFALPDPGRVSQFEARFKATTGQEPHSLSGLGYDGTLVAIALVRKARNKRDNSPFDARDIRSMSFDGATGVFRFNRAKLADRALAVMQVRGGKAVVVSLAPASK